MSAFIADNYVQIEKRESVSGSEVGQGISIYQLPIYLYRNSNVPVQLSAWRLLFFLGGSDMFA
jgi:hypothetical protein